MINWFKRWLDEPEPKDPHLHNIIQAAKAEISSIYGVADPKVERVAQSPPTAMKHLPRSGKAWFVVFPFPQDTFTVSIVEVDDATETVTRVWAPPR